jgi:hypothetical protein
MGGRGSGRKLKTNYVEKVGRPIGTKFVSVEAYQELKENAEDYITSQHKAHKKTLWVWAINGYFFGGLAVALMWNNPAWTGFLLGGLLYAYLRWLVNYA